MKDSYPKGKQAGHTIKQRKQSKAVTKKKKKLTGIPAQQLERKGVQGTIDKSSAGVGVGACFVRTFGRAIMIMGASAFTSFPQPPPLFAQSTPRKHTLIVFYFYFFLCFLLRVVAQLPGRKFIRAFR